MGVGRVGIINKNRSDWEGKGSKLNNDCPSGSYHAELQGLMVKKVHSTTFSSLPLLVLRRRVYRYKPIWVIFVVYLYFDWNIAVCGQYKRRVSPL